MYIFTYTVIYSVSFMGKVVSHLHTHPTIMTWKFYMEFNLCDWQPMKLKSVNWMKIYYICHHDLKHETVP